MNEQYNHMMSSLSPLLLIGNIIYVSALNRLIDIVTWSPTFQESSWNLFYSSFMGVGVNNPGELDHTGQYGRQVISHWTLQQQPVRSILFFQSHLLLFIDFELFRPTFRCVLEVWTAEADHGRPGSHHLNSDRITSYPLFSCHDLLFNHI